MLDDYRIKSGPVGYPKEDKPEKPYPDFPLFAHANGCWAKKIRGKMHYFGLWEDPDGALAKYLERKDDLHAGRTLRPEPGQVTVKDVCNAFLNAKQAKIDAGELSLRTWAKYKEVSDLLVKEFGKGRLVSDLRGDDFARLRGNLAERWGPLRLGDTIQHIRSVFKLAFDSDLIDRPVKFGPGFARPSAKVIRLHKAEKGAKLFSADELQKILDTSTTPFKAMLLLGLNCGYGNADVGTLPLTALDLERGWVDYPRPKTGIPRRCPLWPETVAAIRDALAQRPKPKPEHAGLVFLSQRGTPICSVREANRTDGVAVAFKGLLKRAKLVAKKGLGFYTLRHVFRTVADGGKDQPAADFIMGHEVQHMSAVYRETISDARLQAVTDHVRSWLFNS